jgi:hypothetical protein
MLEHSSLLVHGWTLKALADGEKAWIRPIADAGGRSLGFARFVGNPQSAWFSWFRKRRLDIFETDDASHLMTLTRSWGMLRSWDLHDAEDRHVGNVYSRTIVSGEGEQLGFLDRQGGRILDPASRVLARFGSKSAGILEVKFTHESTANPFLRMLILGCILTLDPTPPKIHG